MENNYNNNFNSGSPYSYNQTNQQTGDGTNTSWSSQVNGNTSRSEEHTSELQSHA